MSKLRCGFLPSDFHPMVLLLGEAGALKQFAGLLRSFSENPRRIEFSDLDFLRLAPGTEISLTTGETHGMQRTENCGRSLIWTLHPFHAAYFADEIETLCAPGLKAGSVFLRAARDEIEVKVSTGEYTDDFLLR